MEETLALGSLFSHEHVPCLYTLMTLLDIKHLCKHVRFLSLLQRRQELLTGASLQL